MNELAERAVPDAEGAARSDRSVTRALMDRMQTAWKTLVVGVPYIWLLIFFLAPRRLTRWPCSHLKMQPGARRARIAKDDPTTLLKERLDKLDSRKK